MNKYNRMKISEWIDKLNDIKGEVDAMQEEESNKYDNLPEGLQDSEKGEAIYESVENLESAANSLEEAIDYLEDAKK